MAEPLSWTGLRAKGTPTKTIVPSVFIPACPASSAPVSGPMPGILAVVVLSLAFNTCFLPIICTLTDKGCEAGRRVLRDGDRIGIGGEPLVFLGTREDRR